MYCRYCGAVIEDSSVFCSRCGKPTAVNETYSEKKEIEGPHKEGIAIAGFILSIPVFIVSLLAVISLIPEFLRTTAHIKPVTPGINSATPIQSFGMLIPLMIYMHIPAIVLSSVGLKKSKGWVLSKIGFILSFAPEIFLSISLIVVNVGKNIKKDRLPKSACINSGTVYESHYEFNY